MSKQAIHAFLHGDAVELTSVYNSVASTALNCGMRICCSSNYFSSLFFSLTAGSTKSESRRTRCQREKSIEEEKFEEQ
jgi:hypothetical protein